VIVRPTDGEDYNALRRAISDRAVLAATEASELQFRWDADHLAIVCDRCGVERIDIMTRLDAMAGVKVSYEGFPAGTALE
jgi:hypothetical protein